MAPRAGFSGPLTGDHESRGRWVGENLFVEVMAWWLAFSLVGCGSSVPSGSRAPTEPSTVAAVALPAAVQKPPEGPTTAPASPPDPCHIDDELGRAHAAFASTEPGAPWLAKSRSHLLSREDAERALGGIAQAILSALAYRHYDKLRHFADEDGICLRASRGAPCETLTLEELTACGHFGKRRAWAVDEGQESPPEYTCGEAFRKIFYARDFLRVPEVHFNCFPEPGRSKSTAPIILAGPALGYVEFRDSGPSDGKWRSLWLVFDGEPTAPVLAEMISDY